MKIIRALTAIGAASGIAIGFALQSSTAGVIGALLLICWMAIVDNEQDK